jgi:hypothetical protein
MSMHDGPKDGSWRAAAGLVVLQMTWHHSTARVGSAEMHPLEGFLTDVYFLP